MNQPDLDHLVRLARRERPPTGSLTAIARSLRVPFVAVPIAAAVMPSSAFAAILAKTGVSRLWLLGWGAGSAVAVTGAVAAVTLSSAPSAPIDPPPVVDRVVATEPARESAPISPPAISTEAPPPATSVEPAKVRETPTPWNEPQLIERARRALGTDPRKALALTQEYQRRFPGGALSVEREVIALEALARLGQVAEARKRALAFESKHPTSIHLPRVRALLAKLGTP